MTRRRVYAIAVILLSIVGQVFAKAHGDTFNGILLGLAGLYIAYLEFHPSSPLNRSNNDYNIRQASLLLEEEAKHFARFEGYDATKPDR